MPPGRRFRLGGACTPPHAPDLQHLLPVYRQWNGSRGFVAGRVFAGVPYAWELSLGARRVCDLGDFGYAEPVDRSLPANQAGSIDGFFGRCNARRGEQGIGGPAAGPAVAFGRAEFAGAGWVGQAFAGFAGGGDFAGPATTRVCGDPAGFVGA